MGFNSGFKGLIQPFVCIWIHLFISPIGNSGAVRHVEPAEHLRIMGSYHLFQWRVQCVETSCADKQRDISSKAGAMPYQHGKFTVYNVSVWTWNILCGYNDYTKMHICEMCNGFLQLSEFWGVFRLYKWAYCRCLCRVWGTGDEHIFMEKSYCVT